MNQQIAQQLQISEQQVSAVLSLLNEGATIPFMARYRKERTGGLDEVILTQIRDLSEKIKEFNSRKESIHKSLEEQGILTDELLKQLVRIKDKSELEDFYLPYKPKRKTKASVARANGLEPLAKMIMAQKNPDVERSAASFTHSSIANADEAIQGALDIIAEWVNEHAGVRRRLRNLFEREALITSKLVKSKEEEAQSFQMYFSHEERIKHAALPSVFGHA